MKNIAVIGSLNLDVDIYCQRRPQPGETVMGDYVSLVPGGKGANQAYALAKMDVHTSMIGAVGRDSAGQQLKDNLSQAGVDISGIREIAVETGKAFIEIEADGQNSITVIAGANAAVHAGMVRQGAIQIKEAEAVLLQLEIPQDAVAEAVLLAKKQGKLVILDPAPVRADLSDEFLQQVDIIKPNETELSVLTGLPATNEAEVFQAAQVLLHKGIRVVLATLGAKGCMLVTEKGHRYFPAYKTKAVDTTAAGDCFLAAFLSRFDGRFSEENLAEAIDFASRASALAVSRKGAQSSIPSAAEVASVSLS